MKKRKKFNFNPDERDEKILDKLANSKMIPLRIGIALNDETPIKTLIRLSDDEDEAVRQAVMRNPKTPNHVRVIMNL